MVDISDICKVIYAVGYNNLDDIELYFCKGKNQETLNDNYFDDAKTFYLYSNYKYFKKKLNINNIHYSKHWDSYDSEIHIINNRTKKVGVVIYGSLYLYTTGECGDNSSLNLGGYYSYIFLTKDELKKLGLDYYHI